LLQADPIAFAPMSFALKLGCFVCVVALAAAGLMPRIAARLSAHDAAPAQAAGPVNAIARTRVAAAAPTKEPGPAAAPEAKRAASPVASGDGDGFGFRRVDLPVGPGGHFRANVEIDGRTVPMLVDTGASYVVLSAELSAPPHALRSAAGSTAAHPIAARQNTASVAVPGRVEGGPRPAALAKDPHVSEARR
jgi:predicted aspartyl protease